MTYQQVYVGSLNLFNCLRILLSPALRRAGTIYCKETGALGRGLFASRIRIIPDHSFVPFGDANFADSRAARIFTMAHDRNRDEGDRYFARFLEQSMAASIFESVVLVMDHEVISAGRSGNACILVPFTPFLSDLRRRYRTPQRDVTWAFGARRANLAVRILVSQCTKILRAVVSIVRQVYRRQRLPPPPALSVHSFRSSYAWDARHDLDWLTVARPAHTIIFEYAQPRFKVSAGFVAELAARGIRIVETHNRPRRLAGAESWHPGYTFLRSTIAGLLAFVPELASAVWARSAVAAWRSVQRLQFQMLRAERADYYDSLNVKAEMISGFIRAEPAHSSALVARGGISCVAQHSAWSDHFASHTSTSTFHLSFGTAVTSWKLPFLAEYGVLNGYLFKTAAAGTNPLIPRVTSQFRTAGVRRTVCFLDEGLEHHDLVSASFALYEYLLGEVLTDPQFGLIIKPKKDDTIDALRVRFGSRLSDARASGRLIVLDRRHYPGHAARCADLTVGVLGTAPFECAIVGGRTIYLSPFGYVPRFMEDTRHNVFSSAADAIAAVERFLAAPAESSIGVHSERFLESLDHYRDAQTSDRIQFLLTNYLDEIGRGRTRQQAIAATIHGFASRWELKTVDAPDLSEAEAPGHAVQRG